MCEMSVDVVLKNTSSLTEREVISICSTYLSKNRVPAGSVISKFDTRNNFMLHEEVEHLIVDTGFGCAPRLSYTDSDIKWYIYRLDKAGPQNEITEDESGCDVNLATYWILPSLDMFNLWENLIYDTNIKENLLNYASTMMEFSNKGIDSNIISCNRVILLHGPPGTGKTSLCKALAQKLSVRLRNNYTQCMLVEINSHSLFSKWFSESGKLVTKMFNKVREIVEVPSTLVCVLIDEIESLAHAREQCLSGNEPSDAIKVVNAVLTQIDQIKRFPNVLILTTSNMTAAIDIAFVDRADIKQYVGPPGVKAIYKIYLTCLLELIKVELIDLKSFDGDDLPAEHREKLLEVCEMSVNLSGRMLRKIPFFAHALFLQKEPTSLSEFLDAMVKAVQYECSQREHLKVGKNTKENNF